MTSPEKKLETSQELDRVRIEDTTWSLTRHRSGVYMIVIRLPALTIYKPQKSRAIARTQFIKHLKGKIKR